jgi:hypothetical protein
MAFAALLLVHTVAAEEHPGREGRSRHHPPRLRAGVRVLDAPTMEALTHNPEGQTTLVFGSITPSLRRLSRGDVLVGSASTRAPQGLLRRVTRAVRRNGSLVVETEPATLEDLFWRARAGARVEMKAADIAAATAQVEGVLMPDPEAMAQAWSPGRLEFELLDVVLLDLDGNPTTTGDQVRATGKLGVEPTFDVDIDIAWGEIQRFQFTNATELSATLELDGRVTVADLDRTITVASVRFAPVTIYVGPVPLVFTPILDVQVGVSGNVTAGIRTSVTATTPVSAGALYENRQWTGFVDLPDGPEDIDVQWLEPELTGEATATLYAGPQLTVLLYDLGGPFASVYGSTTVQAQVLPSRSWSLGVGLRGSIGLVATVPPTGEKVRYDLEVFNRSWMVAGGSF